MHEIRYDPDHEAVLEANCPHLVVIAPPGTGKTSLSVRLAGKIAPSLETFRRVLVLTFSNQARSQLEREAVNSLSPQIRRQVVITNYHSFFWYEVMAYRRALGLPMQIDIGSRLRRLNALRRVRPELAEATSEHVGLVESLAEHAYSCFRDHRTPTGEDLEVLIETIREEQKAGRLVFDDLGALFWQLLEEFPIIEQAYRSRYPVIIADEHQDASALQDAVVRRLASRLVIFADPMQLIHEYRGACRERLECHLSDCEMDLGLATLHRWHEGSELADWLCVVRDRLLGKSVPAPAPPQLTIKSSPKLRGFNGIKGNVKLALFQAVKEGARAIAVIARKNEVVADIQMFLCKSNWFPQQIGKEDFEDARIDIEQLPELIEPQAIATFALQRLVSLVPTIDTRVIAQIQSRLGPTGINMLRAGKQTRGILLAFGQIYEKGNAAYFQSVLSAIEALASSGHHLPRRESVRALRMTVEQTAGEQLNSKDILDVYSSMVVASSYRAPRHDRGLFVMNAHQAKGKEFDAVVVADLIQRYWPDNEESRRLLYVVVTRATKSLFIITQDDNTSPLLRYLCD